MSVSETIAAKLKSEFAPTHLEVIDESEDHRGHGGWREGGETHFRVVIKAPVFTDQSRVARQRAVYKALADELAGPVHALALEVEGA